MFMRRKNNGTRRTQNKNRQEDVHPSASQMHTKDTAGAITKQHPTGLFKAPITPTKIAIYCLLAVLIVALIILGRFIYRTVLNPVAAFPETTPKPTVFQTEQPTKTPLTKTAVEPTPTPLSPEQLLAMQADTDFMKDRVNVLITGIDYSKEREGRTDFRTDTILLVSINFATGEADLLSIPRDSYADIAFTDRKWKINGAFMSAGGAEGQGFECMMETVSNTIGGIPVNYYLAVEMQAVKDIVNIMGGVWYDVDYEIDMNGRHLDKGYQYLDGQAVLDYCRARKGITSGSDIDRIDRQQRLLMDVFNQMKQASLLNEIPEIFSAVESQIYTNLNFEQIVALTLFGLDLDLESECDRYTLKGKYMRVYNASYYVLDHTYTEEVVKDIFGVEPNIDWSYSLKNVRRDCATPNPTASATPSPTSPPPTPTPTPPPVTPSPSPTPPPTTPSPSPTPPPTTPSPSPTPAPSPSSTPEPSPSTTP